jgi:hypothetical protein
MFQKTLGVETLKNVNPGKNMLKEQSPSLITTHHIEIGRVAQSV